MHRRLRQKYSEFSKKKALVEKTEERLAKEESPTEEEEEDSNSPSANKTQPNEQTPKGKKNAATTTTTTSKHYNDDNDENSETSDNSSNNNNNNNDEEDDEDEPPMKSNWMFLDSLGLNDRMDDDLFWEEKLTVANRLLEENIKEHETKIEQQQKQRQQAVSSPSPSSSSSSSLDWIPKPTLSLPWCGGKGNNTVDIESVATELAAASSPQKAYTGNNIPSVASGSTQSSTTNSDTTNSDSTNDDDDDDEETDDGKRLETPIQMVLSGSSFGGIFEQRSLKGSSSGSEHRSQKKNNSKPIQSSSNPNETTRHGSSGPTTILTYRHHTPTNDILSMGETTNKKSGKRFSFFRKGPSGRPEESSSSKGKEDTQQSSTSATTPCRELLEARNQVRKLRKANHANKYANKNTNDLRGEEDIVCLYRHKAKIDRLLRKQQKMPTVETILTQQKQKSITVQVVPLS